MFDPRSPYHRRMWHYDSDRALSVAQLVALGSLDVRTAALLWLLVDRHRSLIVSGPTDPTPGVGKTTTLNALLGFLPVGSTLVYTVGMYEDFEFTSQVDPTTTTVLANEVSDHLRIYMWGRTARQLLRLPQEGYAIATSCHADTMDDVLAMLLGDLRLSPEDVSRLGVVVNIGLVGDVWPPRRRFLTVNFIAPEVAPAPQASGGPDTPRRAHVPVSDAAARLRLLPLAAWDEISDTFIPADAATLDALAGILEMERAEFDAALARREECLAPLVQGRGAGLPAFRSAVDALGLSEHPERAATVAAMEADEAASGEAEASE